jgi:hypothetical protein
MTQYRIVITVAIVITIRSLITSQLLQYTTESFQLLQYDTESSHSYYNMILSRSTVITIRYWYCNNCGMTQYRIVITVG